MRAVAYLRVATQEQAISTDKLIEQMKAEIEKLGWAFVGAYVDVGTGLGMNRPGLTQMLGESGADKFDVVYARSSSQLARNVAHIAEIGRQLKKKGVKAYCAAEGVDPTDMSENLMSFMNPTNEAVAGAEREYDEVMENLEEMLGYMDDLNHSLSDDVDRHYLKGIEIRVADRTIKLPLTEVTFTAIYDALGIIQDEM